MTAPYESPDSTARESGVLHNTLDDFIRRLNAANFKLVDNLVRQLLSLQKFENPNAEALARGPLLEALPAWINHFKAINRSPQTIRTYTLYLNELLEAFPQPTRVLVETHLAHVQARGSSPNSLAGRVAAYKSFFSFLTQIGILNQDPSEHLSYPKRPLRMRSLPPKDDLAMLIASELATPRDRAMLLLGAGCGLRIAEILSLRVSAIDFEHSELTVIGKGSKQRSVPMPPEVAEAVILHIASLPFASKLLFPGASSHRQLTPQAALYRFHKLCDSIGIERITPHQLRHYYTTSLLNAGANLKTVVCLLGHSSPNPTINSYWHLENAKSQHATIAQYNPIRALLPDDESPPGGH